MQAAQVSRVDPAGSEAPQSMQRLGAAAAGTLLRMVTQASQTSREASSGSGVRQSMQVLDKGMAFRDYSPAGR